MVFQDGTKVTPTWYSHNIWIGDELKNMTSNLSQNSSEVETTMEEKPTFVDVPGQVISAEGFSIVLEVVEPGHELFGEKIYLNRRKIHFVSGHPFTTRFVHFCL